jgi:hypothetical protein
LHTYSYTCALNSYTLRLKSGGEVELRLDLVIN